QTATEGAKLTTLDEVERTLTSEDVVICDTENILALAGVMGGKNSAVTETTTSIFLESAYFDAVFIRKSAKRQGLSTDASFRFERGIDPSITEYALKRAAILIKELAGGEITSDITDLYPKKVEGFSVILNFENLNRIVGQKISQEAVKNILTSLEIKIASISETGLGLICPAYRGDDQREIDVIEEVLRIYGYNKIQSGEKKNASVSNSARTEEYKLQNITANMLTSLGFHEIMCTSLTPPEYI